jgi:O-antigen ligase
MKFMKQLLDISSNFSFYALLGFLSLIHFSMAGCYVIFTLLLIQLIIFSFKVIQNKNKNAASANENAKSKEFPVKFPGMPIYFKLFLLYIIFSFISTLFSIDFLNSLKDNKEFFIFLLIPIYLMVISSRKRLEVSFFTVLASAAASALLGIGITIVKGTSLDYRLKGLTSHWMTYSGLLMMVFIFFFVYLFYEKKKKTKIIISLSQAVMLAAVLLSLTRSMWVGIFVSLAIFIIYYKPRILFLAVPALIIIVLVLPASVKNRIVSTFDMNNATNKDRIYMVATGIDIFKDHPLTGVGPDNIKNVYDRYKPPEAELSNPHLHNNFLNVLAERGIFALICLVAAFVFILIQLIKKIKNSIGFEKTIATGALFVFIGFLVSGMFEYNFGDSEIKFLLFYFLSIPFIGLADKKRIPERDKDTNGVLGAKKGELP